MPILLKAKEILDSENEPTVEVELATDLGKFRASCPSGISTGKYEAPVVAPKQAIENIEKIIKPAIEKEDITDQKKIDETLAGLEAGANAILPVSMAVCRAAAQSKKLPLYRYLAELTENNSPLFLPRPAFNLIEGGAHSAGSGLAFQEFMIVPAKTTFEENLTLGQKTYQDLKDILAKQFGEIKLSAEGAFAAPLDSARAALNFISQVVSREEAEFALDAAASNFYSGGSYRIGETTVSPEELAAIYHYLASRYPIISIEDPFQEEDFQSFAELKSELGKALTIFGDDLTVSNEERIKLAQEKGACNGLVLKPNQIGTLTKTIEAAKLAKSYGWKIMVANRAGETEDDFIADLAVGIGADFIKSGAPYPKERMAKYDRLLNIERELK